jgi:Protein of unknown function (DUF3626)
MSLIALAEEGRASIDMLDCYIEAHVHGPLILADDVEAIVLDPCYRDPASIGLAVFAVRVACPVRSIRPG